MWLYSVGMGVVEVVSKGMSTLGALVHVLENLIW